MLPTANISVWFIPSLIGAYYLSIVIHELGHVAAARLVRLRVVACGIGFRRPAFRFRCLGIVIYLARPFSGGLTVFAPDHFRVPRMQMIVAIAGGPAANGLTAVAVFALWQAGLQTDFLALLFYLSSLLLLVSAIPHTATCGSVKLPNDAQQIVHEWRKTLAQLDEPGQRLAAFSALRELCQALGAPIGTAYTTLGTALYQASLCDAESARDLLEDEAETIREGGMDGHPLEAIVRCAVAAADPQNGFEQQFQDAWNRFQDDPETRAALRIVETEVALERGDPAAELARQAVEDGARSDLPQLGSAAQALLLEADPPEDLAAQCRTLLAAKGRRQLTPLSALRLRCAVTRLLAERGETTAAREMFREAKSQLMELSGTIHVEITRERFLARASRPLHVAVQASAEGVPLFLTNDDASKNTATRSPEESWRRSPWRLAFWGSVGVVVGSIIGALVMLFLVTQPEIYARLAPIAYRRAAPAGREGRLKYDSEALHLLETAKHEAAARRHEYVGAEHLLLAIVAVEPDLLAFHGFEIVPETVRAEIERLLPAGPNATAPKEPRRIPYSPLLIEVIEKARQEAQIFGDDAVTPNHLLLGILYQSDTVAARVLQGDKSLESSHE